MKKKEDIAYESTIKKKNLFLGPADPVPPAVILWLWIWRQKFRLPIQFWII